MLTEARKQPIRGIAADGTTETGDDSGSPKAAENEAKQVREAANLSIEQAKREAELQLRKQVASLSLQIAEKVMRKDLATDKSQMELIGKLLNELENKE